MAIGILFAATSMTAQQYDDCIRKLEQANAGNPPGRVYHACFGAGDKLQVFDVWESQAAFDQFGQTLMPILQQLGIETYAMKSSLSRRLKISNIILASPDIDIDIAADPMKVERQ